MEEFLDNFDKMIHYGFLGVYKRLKLIEENSENLFVPALTKACGISAFLNFKYALQIDGKRILPETEYRMFKMFELPLAEIIDALPEEYRTAVMKKDYDKIGALFAGTGNGQGIITGEGYNMLNDSALHASKDLADQMGEYDGQRVFEELCKGDYIENRMFLEQTENVYIPENATQQSDEQYKFIKAFPELFRMCYQKNTRTSLYRCKRCGMVLRENRKGIFFCVSEKCNGQLEKKTEIEMYGYGWIMKDIVARSIYYPGRLEQIIKEILEEGTKSGLVKEYELWPGKYEGRHDTWDFKVKMPDGRMFLVDAKDVENQYWIFRDKRVYLDGAELIYVVPDDRKKAYVDQINNHPDCIGKVRCVRVREFKKMIGVK